VDIEEVCIKLEAEISLISSFDFKVSQSVVEATEI
jgi:hypothetical protein